MARESESDGWASGVKRIIAWTLGHRTIVLSTASLVFALAAVNMYHMPVRFMPDVDRPAFLVRTEFPGLPAAEVVDLLTIPVERALSGVSGVSTLTSTTRTGVSAIEAGFHAGVRREQARAEIRQAADAVYPSLPEGIQRPVVLQVPVFHEAAAVVAVLPRDADMSTTRRVSNYQIRSALQQIDGTGTIVVSGGSREEVHVRVDPNRLAAAGLSFGHVSNTVESSVFEHTAGRLTLDDQELQVVTDASVSTAAMLGHLVVGDGSGGYPVTLESLAEIVIRDAPREVLFTHNGQEAVGVSVYARPGQSPAQVADRVVAFVQTYNENTSHPVVLAVASDGAEALRTAVRDLLVSGLLGSICAFLVVVAFSRSTGSAMAVLCSIPASMSLSLVFLQHSGTGINLMSLSGLAVAVGMIVDNSIVVAENLSLKVNRPADAVYEVAGAGLSGTLTTVIVFLPLLGLPGLLGSVYRDLVFSVILALCSSYVVSVLLVPTVWSFSKRPHKIDSHPSSHLPEKRLRIVSAFAETKRSAVFVFAGLCTIALSGTCSAEISPVEPLDTGIVSIRTRFDANTPFDRLRREALALEQLVGSHTEVLDIYSTVGGEPDDPVFLGSVDYEPGEIRSEVRLQPGVSVFRFADRLRGQLRAAGLDSRVTVPASPLSRIVNGELNRGFPVRAESIAEAQAEARAILSRENRDMDRAMLDQAIVPTSRIASVYVRPRMQALHRFGLNGADVTRLLYAQTTGVRAGRAGPRGEQIDVRMFYGSGEHTVSPSSLSLTTPSGERLPLSLLAEVSRVEAPVSRIRVDQADAVFLHDGYGPSVPAAAPGGTETGRLILVFAVALCMLFLVLVFHFDRIGPAVAIMATIPFSWLGGIAVLSSAGRIVSLESAVGLLVLTGLTVNPGILLVETYDSLRATRLTLHEVLQMGTARRLKPIFMTGITTVVALVPLAIDPGVRSVQSNASLVVLGGIIAGTTATLTIVPRWYRFVYRRTCR